MIKTNAYSHRKSGVNYGIRVCPFYTYTLFAMTSSNGNIFRVTGHLCGEFTCHRWHGALMFSLISVWIYGWVNNREAGDLRRYCVQCDVIVMCSPLHLGDSNLSWMMDAFWSVRGMAWLDDIMHHFGKGTAGIRLSLFHTKSRGWFYNVYIFVSWHYQTVG